MGKAFSFVALLAVLVIGAWYYMHQTQNVISAGTTSPTATVDLMGVRSDLLAIAQAERSHAALKSGFVSIEELRSQGDLTMRRDGRGPYTYSAEFSETSFRIAATHSGPENSGMPHTVSIDQTMEITQQ
jgi:hypothetical protein